MEPIVSGSVNWGIRLAIALNLHYSKKSDAEETMVGGDSRAGFAKSLDIMIQWNN